MKGKNHILRLTVNTLKQMADVRSLWSKVVEYSELTENEAKIYLSLLTLGRANVRQLYIDTNVPRQKIYPTLVKLIEYGLALEIPETPSVYIPKNPKEIFEKSLEQTKNKATDFEATVRSMLETFESTAKPQFPSTKQIWHFDSSDEIERICNQIIKRAERELTILTNSEGIGVLFRSASRPLDQARMNVKITCCTNIDPRTDKLARELNYELHVKPLKVESPIFFLNRDDEEFFLAKLAPKGSEDPFESAIFSNDESLVKLLSLIVMC